MPVIAYTYPGTFTRTRWRVQPDSAESVARQLREAGMVHVVIEEDA
jgi:hypothetical protein